MKAKEKRWMWKKLRIGIAVLVAMVLALFIAVPTLGATSVNVTITAQGAFVSYTANQSSYDFGIVAASSTTNTTANWILFTNTSSVSTNISVVMLATTWTAAVAGWTHSDTARGNNTAAMKASSGNATTWGDGVFIKFAATANEINTAAIPAGYNYVSGLSLLAPTIFMNGNSNNNTVQFAFYQS